jgi:hypothetical protein
MRARIAQWLVWLARKVDPKSAERTTIGGGGGPG